MRFEKDTSEIERYLALDIHKEYALVGGQNGRQEWLLAPRRIAMEKLCAWAEAHLRKGDAVVIETTTNVWDVYDIIEPRVSYVVVAHAGAVRQIAEARVKTDKKDLERLLRLLIADLVPGRRSMKILAADAQTQSSHCGDCAKTAGGRLACADQTGT